MKSRTLLKKRLMLIGLLSVFIVPLLLASSLYAKLDWRPDGTTNNGTILAQPLSDQGRVAFVEDGRWTLLMPVSDNCPLSCQADLFKIRQVREALGKYVERIGYRVLLVNPDVRPLPADLIQQHQHMAVMEDAPLWQELKATKIIRPGEVLLIDPLGNLVMHYESEFVAKDLYKDLKRLLKLSNIG